jgi:hypothetical protein
MHGMHNLLIKNRTLHENTWKSFKLHPNLVMLMYQKTTREIHEKEEHNNRSVLIKKKILQQAKLQTSMGPEETRT